MSRMVGIGDNQLITDMHRTFALFFCFCFCVL